MPLLGPKEADLTLNYNEGNNQMTPNVKKMLYTLFLT